MTAKAQNTSKVQAEETSSVPFSSPGEGEIIYSEDTDRWNMQLFLSADELECYASMTPKGAGAGADLITPQEMLGLLQDSRVVEGIDMQALENFCAAACKGKTQENVLLARTEAPIPGEDGWVELKVRIGHGIDDPVEYVEDERGRVDLYTLDLFTCITPGQQIAIIHPPGPGQESTTVTGKVLEPEPGNPADVRMGSGVQLTPDNDVISDISGRAEYHEGVISVSEDYNIHGDVDLRVGNIKFPGNVNVSGDVLDDFDISSDKDINIKGTVGSCYLNAGGNIKVGGVAGQHQAYIKCKGNFEANYINGAHVECMGDVIVSNEIRNSTVKSAGRIIIKSGQISGGEFIALKGIEAKIIGAAAGAQTVMTSGVYFPEEDRLMFLKAQKKSIKQQKEFIQRCIGPLEQKISESKVEGSAQEKRLEILNERLELLEQMDMEVRQELNNFILEEHDGNAKINVQHLLKEKVEIRLENVTEWVRMDYYGPLSIIADKLNLALSFNTYSPLEINAADMEPEEPPADLPEAE